MKVFLSWSGEKSHKIAMVFRDWLPSVIQSIVPYVSSEDIDKGARWSTDIARELEDSTFGILCVTKDNINAPWLTFEAGALSKTMDKSFVVPFLFDIKRSEVDGPLLQFQSTIFEKNDIKKLMKTLNKACGDDSLPSDRLDKAFEVWYPTLEEELQKIKELDKSDDKDTVKDSSLEETKSNEILEEILELTRINQKLLRNPEGTIVNSIKELQALSQQIYIQLKEINRIPASKRKQKFHPMIIEEILHLSPNLGKYIGFQMILSIFKDDFPWIYDAGVELIHILKSKRNKEVKENSINEFKLLLEFTFDHPIMRDFYGFDKELRMYYRKIPYMLMKILDREEL